MDILATRRLTLRPVLPPDAGDIAHWLADDAVAANLARLPSPYREAEAEAWIGSVRGRTDDLAFGIHRERLIGVVAIAAGNDDLPTLGYWLGAPFHGRGLMTEAAGALVAHGFASRPWAAIGSAAFAGNAASLAVQRKLGFRKTGHRTIRVVRSGIDMPSVTTMLTRSAFADRAGPAPLHWTA